jgi:hypothetical protein
MRFKNSTPSSTSFGQKFQTLFLKCTLICLNRSEILYENESFKQRQLAALVASKVYYHLGEYEEALSFALGAGKLFDTALKTEYVDTIICTIFIIKHSEMH